MFLFKYLFLLLGVGLGGLSISMIVLFSGLFTTRCPSINDRTCNNRGTCEAYGICACDPQFSGPACENTACGGYNELSGMVCHGHGVCSPLLTFESTPEQCKEYPPTMQNGLVRSGPGWGSDQCALVVDTAWAKILSGTYQDADVEGIPTCACHPPYGGLSCELNMCPQTSDFQVCGGNGNKSVGLVRNNTNTGNGCQCQHYVSLTDILTLLPRTALEVVHDTYLHDFKLGFCGSPRLVGGTLLLVQAEDDTKCFCDEEHFGQACEYGVCPDSAGVTCSGHGHPNFGFGLVYDSPVKTRPDCTPVCVEGTELCHGRCDTPDSCAVPRDVCPIQTPYRCANRGCVANTPHCTREFEAGSWDNLDLLPASLRHSFAAVFLDKSLVRRANALKASFGSNASVTASGIVPGGTLVLPSRLFGVEMELSGDGNVTISDGTDTEVRQAPGKYRLQWRNSAPEYEFSGYRVQASRMQTPGYYLLDPMPWTDNTTLRLERDGFQRVVSVLRMQGNHSLVVTSRVDVEWNPSGYEWNVFFPRLESPPVLTLERTRTAEILSIGYTLESDITKPCICQVVLESQAEKNELFLTQVSRPLATSLGDLGVGVVSIQGVLQPMRGTVASVMPFMLQAASEENYEVLGPLLTLTSREMRMGAVECNPKTHPVRCRDGSCSALKLQLIPNVQETCQCVLSQTGTRCSCQDIFGEVGQCDGGAKAFVDLDESCFWSHAHPAVATKGYRHALNTTFLSRDTHTFPLSFTTTCDTELFSPDFPLQSECVNNTLSVRLVHSLFGAQDIWTVTSTKAFSATFFTHLGGLSVFGLEMSISTRASSSTQNPPEVVRNTDSAVWASRETDHEAFLMHTFSRPLRLLNVYIEFETAGLASSDGIPFPVSVLIQGSKAQDPRPEDWTTVGRVRETVVHGSSSHTVALDHDLLFRSLRLFSHFPLGVRSFIPFTDQNCSSGLLQGTVPNFQSLLPALLSSPPVFHPGCVCDDSCTLQGTPVGKDGICSDELFFTQSGIVEINKDFCASGTDCSDCGTNLRVQFPDRACGSEATAALIERYRNVSLASLANVWLLREFVSLGNAELQFGFTRSTKTVWKWTKESCPRECALHTCIDGTCALSPALCPAPRYSCRGNGCVRADIHLAEYKCACERGWSGLACTIYECTPGDPETGSVDPHKWCTCNGPSPLKIQPPFELVWGAAKKTYFSDEDILALNRPSRRSGALDVGWVKVRADKAPYGIPFLRRASRGNSSFLTNCPYRVRTRLGQYLELEECVGARNLEPPNAVLVWRVLEDGQTIPWTYETQFDDSPYRCPAGHCVPHERDCSSQAIISPVCGGMGGKCLSDGTCNCAFGRETFIVTEDLTQLLQVPYKHTGSTTNPIVWGVPNDNRYVSEWCQARNCSEVDCSPPLGCFPGTPLLQFLDKDMECPEPFHGGKCATDIHDCMSGNVRDPQLCSGNGELRRRDYRQDEYYCACGSMVDGTFRSNGYGGTACQDYSCQDDPTRIYYARTQPHTLVAYTDLNGNRLPGKWLGPCGVSVGANPDHRAEWSRCCPGETQLERCDKVPCLIGGVTQCVDVDECLGTGRIPKVYACNGKGTVLADGSCSCTKDENKGTGYTYDLSVYSTKGCFAKIQCPIARSSGTVCNAKKACGDFASWTEMPNIAYVKQQAVILAAREGLPLTNQSIVQRLVGDDLDQVILQTYVSEAMLISAFIKALATDICVYPGENSSHPVGMQPYPGLENIVGPYKKAIRAPFMLQSGDVTFMYKHILMDGLWSSSNYADYTVIMNPTAVVQVIFSQPYYVDIIRVHVLTLVATRLTFEGSVSICPPLYVNPHPVFQWVTVFCIPTYSPARFDLDYPNEWNAYCKLDVSSVACEEWMRTTCLTIPNGEVRENGTLASFYGCNQARCCIAEYTKSGKSTYLAFHSTASVYTDEIAIFVHGETVQPLPTGLKNMFQQKSGQSECVDEMIFFHPSLGVGGHLSPFRGGRGGLVAESRFICNYDGGVFASNVGETDITTGYANALGASCYQGMAQSSPGCFVNARNRYEYAVPNVISRYIVPSCSNFGCVQRISPYLTYHHSPDNGAMWAAPWHPQQLNYLFSWQFFLDQLIIRQNDRGLGAVPNLQVKYYMFYERPDRIIIYRFSDYNDVVVDWWSLHFMNGYAGTIQYIPEPLLIGQIPSGGELEVSTSLKSCLVVFFSQPNCGFWEAPGAATFLTGTIMRGGAWKAYRLSGTSTTKFGSDLIQGATFDHCVDHGHCPSDGNIFDVQIEKCCWDLGGPLTKTQSFLIQGDCTMDITGVTTGNVVYTHSGLAANRKAGSGAILRTVSNPWFTYAHEGCYPQFPYALGLNTKNDYLNPRFTSVLSAVVYPTFSNVNIVLRPMAEPRNVFAETEQATLGYLDNPYMCLELKAFHSSSFSVGTGLRYFGNVITDGVPMSLTSFALGAYGQLSDTIFGICARDGYDSSTCTLPLTPCAPIRPVIQCKLCPVAQPPAKFEWSQEFAHETEFVSTVDAINQVSPTLALSPSPEIHLLDSPPITLASIQDSRRYGRLLSALKISDFRIKFELPYCLLVRPAGPLTYQFSPTLCTSVLAPVCVRDSLKFTVQAGRQCDVCGDSARTEPVDAGATAFSRYPRAKRENDPFGHMLLDAYTDGSLGIDILDNEEIPWNLVFEQIAGSQYIFAFPEARKLLLSGTSTRPGVTSRGQVSDPMTWVDMDFARWFPYTCPPTSDLETGAVTRRCAVSKEYCVRDFEAPLMSSSAMPQLLFGLDAGLEPTTVPECGYTIRPDSFHVYDALGAPQPSSGDFLVSAVNPLVLKAVRGNGTWTNTGKGIGMTVDSAFTVFGTVKASVSRGFFRFWMSKQSPTFSYPTTLMYLNAWTPLTSLNTYHIQHKPSTSLNVFGIDFMGLQVGSQITISGILLTTNESISQCRDRSFIPYLELPSSVESSAPYNRCVYSDMEADLGETTGQCSCAPDSPNGGPTCEWPATTSFRGKNVCNAYGEDGGLALTSAWKTTPLLSDLGVFLDGEDFQCKCMNPGLMVQTILRPASAFDYAFLIRNDKQPNVPEFSLVTEIPEDIAVPVSLDLVLEVCNSISAILPSWNTGGEVERMLAMDVDTFLVDLAYLDGRLMWEKRNEIFHTKEEIPVAVNPCPDVDRDLCDAMNWNNLAYRFYDRPSLDGSHETYEYTDGYALIFPVAMDDVVVEMSTVDLDFTLVVTVDGRRCTLASTTGLFHTFTCYLSTMHKFEFSSRQTIKLREFSVYLSRDTGRVPGIF